MTISYPRVVAYRPSQRRFTRLVPRPTARDIVNGYADPGPRMLPDVVPVPPDLDTDPRESYLAPRRIGAGSVSTTILVILVFVALATLAAVRM